MLTTATRDASKANSYMEAPAISSKNAVIGRDTLGESFIFLAPVRIALPTSSFPRRQVHFTEYRVDSHQTNILFGKDISSEYIVSWQDICPVGIYSRTWQSRPREAGRPWAYRGKSGCRVAVFAELMLDCVDVQFEPVGDPEFFVNRHQVVAQSVFRNEQTFRKGTI
jgi:hypothetical protein